MANWWLRRPNGPQRSFNDRLDGDHWSLIRSYQALEDNLSFAERLMASDLCENCFVVNHLLFGRVCIALFAETSELIFGPPFELLNNFSQSEIIFVAFTSKLLFD